LPKLPVSPKDGNNETLIPKIGDTLPPTLGSKIRSFPQIAADKLTAFAMNEVTILIFMFAFVYYHKILRANARHFMNKWGSTVTDAGWFSHSSNAAEDSDSETDEKPVTVPTEAEAEALGLVAAKEVVSPDSEEVPVDSQKDVRVSFAEPPAAAAPTEAAREATGQDGDKETDNDSPTHTTSDSVSVAQAEGQQKKKKAHRGSRGGKKHRKGPKKASSRSHDDEQTVSTVDEQTDATVDEEVDKIKKMKIGEQANIEPDVRTVKDDMQSVSGPVLRIDNIEVDTGNQLGTGSNGTIVFAGKFDGRVVAVKRMLIQFYDIASQETRLLRESDNHPNGRPPFLDSARFRC
jgi:serine/threonine-protein kinase/endoribonuclease IRE1